MDLNKINKIHFIGIGGIGISATARILNDSGKKVSGSDASQSEITDQLQEEGINIVIGHSAGNINEDMDLVVYTVAANEDNPERKKAKELGIDQITYPQLLGKLVETKEAIGVSGTNGKTTTTAMLSKIFIDAEKDPTVVLGSKAEFLGGNSQVGKSEYLIFESDEYRRAFDNYNPQMVVLTYISADHFDYYKDEEDIKNAFRNYLEKVPTDGYIFINADDKNSIEVSKHASAHIKTYGIENSADVMAKEIRVQNGKQVFSLYYQNQKVGEIELQVPAKYNIYNALAAISPCLLEGIDFQTIKISLENYKGVWRRFQKLGYFHNAEIIVDYAHTPDAIYYTIEAAKQMYPNKKILSVFQPHQYNRTKNLFNDFSCSFEYADKALIMDIFYVKGRENPDDFDVDSKKLAEAIKNQGVDAVWADEKIIKKEIESGDYDVVLMMGAGDVYNLAKDLVQENEDDTKWEEEYGDVEVSERAKKQKVKGTGFSQQKAVVEKNKFYTKGKNVK